MSKVEWGAGRDFIGEGAVVAGLDLFAAPDGFWCVSRGNYTAAHGGATDLAAAKRAAEDAAAWILRDWLRVLGRTCRHCGNNEMDEGFESAFCLVHTGPKNSGHGCYDWSPREVE